MQSESLLYHATGAEYAIDQLKSNRIRVTSIHRFWTDKPMRTHNEKGYDGKTHYWIKGLCFTRNIQFAAKWSDIIWEINRTTINTRYKLKCKDWASTIPRRNISNRGKESEEFLVYRKMKHKRGRAWFLEKQKKEYIKNWLHYVNGFYISTTNDLKHISDEDFQYLTGHPLFLGFMGG